MVRLGVLKKPSDLNDLHQLITVILVVESPGLHLRQHRLTQVHVPLSPIEVDFLLPQLHIEVKGVFAASGVSHHLVKVLFLSSLRRGPLGIEIGTNLGMGVLRNPRLLLLHGQYPISLRELLLPCQEQLLQLCGHHHQYQRDEARRRRWWRPAQSKCGQINPLAVCAQWVPTAIVIR
jgi:hypothetical protein